MFDRDILNDYTIFFVSFTVYMLMWRLFHKINFFLIKTKCAKKNTFNTHARTRQKMKEKPKKYFNDCTKMAVEYSEILFAK